jgi:raffinose/stachyose/melibiose transport system substrate-binding protein
MKKIKRVGLFGLCLLQVFTFSALPTSGTIIEKSRKNVTIKIFQFKIEIASALNRLVKKYEKSHPGVNIKVETVGGGADYGAEIKAKFAMGDPPDIFNDGGYSDLDVWQNKLEDLSKEPWVKNLVKGTAEPMTKDGKLYGQPMNIEGYGFIYNKDLFKKAGITILPKTLPQLETVCSILQKKGITAFSNGYQEYWILGIHNLNVALAAQKNPTKFIEDMKKGNIKLNQNKTFNDWLNLLDLTVKYGNANPITTNYGTQVEAFAHGKAAMMQQGNWTQIQLDKINPKLKLGILPMPINNQVQNKIYVGVPNNWVINKDSKVKKQAKAFLNWMVSSKEGKESLVKDFKFIPAFKNIPYKEEQVGSLAASIKDYAKSGNVLTWNWFKLPDGSAPEIGDEMKKYVLGKYTKRALLDSIQNTIFTFGKKHK